MNINGFLPMTKMDMENLGWERLDFIIVTGDAYIDHPSFGTAIISRVLLNAGFKVGIIAQPDWKDPNSIKALGRPRLGFFVNSGNIDSMVNHYSVSKKRRDKDLYSPGGKMGYRPDRAVLVYTNLIKRAYKKTPIILGGIEASLRRFAHYDYWDNKVRRSYLIDSEADLLVYGMGENQVVEIANCLNDGLDAKYIRHVNGTCYTVDSLDEIYDYKLIESYKEISESKEAYAKCFKKQYDQQDPIYGEVLVQKHGDKYMVQNPPAMPLTEEELDYVHSFPYQRNYHPMYEKMGGVPAIKEVKHSIISERGCFGSCSFCALTFHQGRIIRSRSHESIINEAKIISEMDDFKGYINDVGGPTANFRKPACKKQLKHGSCKDKQCLYPKPCGNMDVDHEDFITLLDKIKKIDGIKKVFVRSGLRYDYIMADKNRDKIMEYLCENNVSGQLKVAPEHVVDKVLYYMGKPAGKEYKNFVDLFFKTNEKIGKEQYIVPYLMSSHPGSDLKSAIKMAEYLRDINYQPKQVQDFYPTPGTLSTAMYHTGLDPRTMEKVYVPIDRREKAMQRALLQFSRPNNYDLVYEALIKAGREDLIGFEKKCFIKPKGKLQKNNNSSHKGRRPSKGNSSRGNKRRPSKSRKR